MNERIVRNSAVLILRIGIGLVFLLFGIDKLRRPLNWVIYLPADMGQAIQNSGLVSVVQFLGIQGFIEAALGFHLIVGCLGRWTALGCSVLLMAIISVIGFGETGIRDVGLLSAALALTFLGPGDWSIDGWLNAKPASRADEASGEEGGA